MEGWQSCDGSRHCAGQPTRRARRACNSRCAVCSHDGREQHLALTPKTRLQRLHGVLTALDAQQAVVVEADAAEPLVGLTARVCVLCGQQPRERAATT